MYLSKVPSLWGTDCYPDLLLLQNCCDQDLVKSGKAGVDACIYTPVRNIKGETEYKSPQDLADATVAFPNELKRGDPYVAALANGKVRMVPREKVDFEIPDMESTFSPLGNMIPFKSMVKGQRAVMAARMLTQALPLRNAEAPLVQSGMPGQEGRSFEEEYAKSMGAVRADVGGRVVAVDSNHITMEGPTGERTEVPLYENFPFNRKTHIHNTPTVQVGDTVKPGQLLARSNFTNREGVTALGMNARVAYVPWGGMNFEDAIVVSEGFAKRMTSEHMYQNAHEWEKTDHKGRNAFMSIFPSKYDKKTLANFDKHGVIKPGTEVHEGDPLILIAKEKERNKKSMIKGGKPSYQDASQTWDHGHSGIVTDVVETDRGVSVVPPAETQDRDRIGYDEETQVLTDRGWVPIAELTLRDPVCTLQEDGLVEYHCPTTVRKFERGGRMYRIKSQQLDLFVTANHQLYVKTRYSDEFELMQASQIYKKRIRYKKNGEWLGESPESVVLEGPVVRAGQSGNGSRKMDDLKLTVETYLMLMGLYVSEGNLVNQPASGSYGIDFTSVIPDRRRELLVALDATEVPYCEHNGNKKVRIYSKALFEHFKYFGCRAHIKRLPVHVFDWSREHLRVLFNWLMWGDGHSKNGRPVCYTTTSPGLADDVQRLCLHVGYAGNVPAPRPAGVQTIKGKEYDCKPVYNVRTLTSKLTPQVNHGHVHQQNAQQEHYVEEYMRPVYGVAVSGKALYVRRNGKPCWCGSSW